jgi:phosphoserine aminotransferase
MTIQTHFSLGKATQQTHASGRVYNFCPGPAMMPESVLLRAQAELLDFKSLGSSVMEISHRGKAFDQVARNSEEKLRKLLNLSDDYAVLFMQGGASLQFSMLPENFIQPSSTAAYIDTGHWSKKAIEEGLRMAQKWGGDLDVVASASGDIPDTIDLSDKSYAYLHYTPNETIEGVAFHQLPFIKSSQSIPLVADYSSSILSEPLDISAFGMIYAGAQKNIGPAGLTLVIIRRDWIKAARVEGVPRLLQYGTYEEQDSMFNTPPTFSWYLADLVFDWLLEQGGLSAIAQINTCKANLLYQTIDASDFYHNQVSVRARSKMNIPFTLANPALDALFLTQAEANGLTHLKGHRVAGGMRASIYNAMPLAGVEALVDFMRDFEKRSG